MLSRPKQILLVAVIVGACGAQQMQQPMDVSAEIQAANNQFSAAYAAGDFVGVATMYTETAQLMPPNTEPVSGRSAIQATMQSFFDAGLASVELTTVEARGVDSLAVEVGRYQLKDATGEIVDDGKYIVWWRRTPDGWRLHRDIFNSNRPLPQSEP